MGNPDPAKVRRDSPMIHAPVLVAYILWTRVLDFVKGEKARTDGPCKFICWDTPSN